jgi:hypothetical protein
MHWVSDSLAISPSGFISALSHILKGVDMKITEQKNGNYTTFERSFPSGYYVVKLYQSGELTDKIMSDNYKGARAYLASFNKIAKNDSQVTA